MLYTTEKLLKFPVRWRKLPGVDYRKIAVIAQSVLVTLLLFSSNSALRPSLKTITATNNRYRDACDRSQATTTGQQLQLPFKKSTVLVPPGSREFPRGLALVKSETYPAYYCFTFHPTRDKFVSGRMFRKGVFDENVLEFVRQAVIRADSKHEPIGDCHVIDAGANIGVVSLYAAALGCHVYSFEMQSQVANVFNMSIHLNDGFSRKINLIVGAIHPQSGMYIDISESVSKEMENAGGVTTLLSDFREGSAIDETSQVNTVVVQDQLPPGIVVDVMKIDVEGAETLVLASTKELWAARRIKHIIMETRRTQTGMFADLFTAGYICGFGSKIYRENNSFMNALKLHLNQLKPTGYVDCFCHLEGQEFFSA